jgi:hypothetical protein
MKICRVCGEAKSTEEYYRHPKTRDGYFGSCKDCERDRSRNAQREKREQDSDYARNAHLKSLYGITIADYMDMLTIQDGCCAICASIEARAQGGNFNVDHDHETGKIRALLCDNCNRGIGVFKDNPNYLIAAAHYILSYKDREAF